MGFHSCAPMSSAPDVHVEENATGGGNTARYLGRYRGVRANGTKTYVNVCVSATYCAKVSGVEVPVRVFRNALANSPTFRR